MLVLKDIDKIFTNGDEKVMALNKVSLTINNNDFVAIMGGSGSGKSTLLNILGGLDQPCNGNYLLNHIDVSTMSDQQLSQIRNQHIGFIFQTFHLLPKLTAVENVKLPLRYSRVYDDAEQRAKQLLIKVGLKDRMQHKPNEMSGGQRQRVAIARALINKPTVLLADEPTGNLDSKTSNEIMEILTELHQQGHTIVMVTHEYGIAKCAQRIINMRDGHIINVDLNQCA